MFESDIDLDLTERLAIGELDVSFVVGDVDPQFESRHLLTDPFVLIARPGQFPPGHVPIADLANEPLIGQHESSCQLINEAGLRKVGLDPTYVFRTNDNGAVAAMVRAGMGVAVLPMLCTEPEDKRIALHPLMPAIPEREISIAWRAGRTLAPTTEHFVELAVEMSATVATRLSA